MARLRSVDVFRSSVMPYCELIIDFGGRCHAIKLEKGDDHIKVADMLRLLARNIERDKELNVIPVTSAPIDFFNSILDSINNHVHLQEPIKPTHRGKDVDVFVGGHKCKPTTDYEVYLQKPTNPPRKK